MTGKSRKASVSSSLESPSRVTSALRAAVPKVEALVAGADVDFVSLYIKMRGEYDFILVCKRYGADGGLEVVFGTGSDLATGLKSLEGSLAANKWRPDTPYIAKADKK